MFFTEYDPLTTKQVKSAVLEQGSAEGGCCGCLAGKSLSLHLEGTFAPEELRYEFSENDLTVTLNGETGTVPYAVRKWKDILMITHHLPDTDGAFHLILDTRTNAVTAIETWFGITVPVGFDMTGKKEPDHYRDIPREVQREIYFGWADFGGGKEPEEKHTFTNRLEGRGFYWKFDHGYEILSFSPAVNYCTVVELGKREMGGITMADPADYIRIDDELYIFARWEPEYSGKMWLELLDLFEMKAAGIELGFEEDNSFTWRFHEAELTMTGVIAHLEMINDNGENRVLPPRFAGKKGARYVYRPKDMHPPISHEEALRKIPQNLHILDNCDGIMDSGHNFPLSAKLVGKTFKVRPDQEKYAAAPWSGAKKEPFWYEYEILSIDRLRWRTPGTEWQEEVYNCFETDKDLFFFSHLMTGHPDYCVLAHVVDFQSGLATTVPVEIGNWHSEWEAGSTVMFGTVEYGDLKPPFTRRHRFTDELLGCCFCWNYTDTMNSIHMYSAPESYSWTIFQPDNAGGVSWSSPGYYIKLRDNVYLLQWIEENCNGNQGLVVINRKLQHDGGFFYGMYEDGLKLSITGAFMRELGKLDIKKYFDKDM